MRSPRTILGIIVSLNCIAGHSASNDAENTVPHAVGPAMDIVDRTGRNTEVRQAHIPVPAIGGAAVTAGAITLTNTFTSAAHVGETTQMEISISAQSCAPSPNGFIVRLRLSPGFHPKWFTLNEDLFETRMHVAPDRVWTDHYYSGDTVNETMLFQFRSTTPGLHAATIEVVPDVTMPEVYTTLEAFTWVVDNLRQADLWADWTLTFPEGQLWYYTPKNKWDQKLRVTNGGLSASRACVARYYRSSDRLFDPGSDVFVRKAKIPALKPGEEYLLDQLINFRQIPSGQYMVVVLDADNRLDEGAEDNNVYALGP